MTFDFKKQLAVGSRGERAFLEIYHRECELHQGRAFDFTSSCGSKVELKTDTYSMSATPNFFIERWSDLGRQKPGGPWQSAEKGVDIFCYYYSKDNTYFEFPDLAKLIKRLNHLTKGARLVYIKNKGWTTAGFLVARDELRDLCDEYSVK